MTRSYIKHGVIGDEEDISRDYSAPVSTSREWQKLQRSD